MDQLLQFITDASLDPPIRDRAIVAARTIDMSVFAAFDPKARRCTEEQRATLRQFLSLTDIEFDDDGWEELLTRPDAQQVLAAALWEGVRDSKVAPVIVAMCKIRASIELAIKEPAFPIIEDEAEDEESPAPRPRVEPSPERLRAVEELLAGGTISLGDIGDADREAATVGLREHFAHMTDDTFAWAHRIRMKFVPQGGNQNLRYSIQELNGKTAYFDGLYSRGGRMYVYPLPPELHRVEGLDDTAEEND